MIAAPECTNPHNESQESGGCATIYEIAEKLIAEFAEIKTVLDILRG